MAREFPGVAFERYVDDAVVHCVSQAQAHQVLAALRERMRGVGLELHPDKTRVVYCKDSNRRGSYEHTAFTFLGYYLMRWLRKKHKRLRGRKKAQEAWTRAVTTRPRFFAHWAWVNTVPAVW
jgi:RNA-directed DNA polymerase